MRIDLDPNLVWCRVHLSRFEARFGGDVKRYTLASGALLAAFLSEPVVVAYCGGIPERGVVADADRIPWAIRRYGPLCDRVSRETLEEILEDAAAGVKWRGAS